MDKKNQQQKSPAFDVHLSPPEENREPATEETPRKPNAAGREALMSPQFLQGETDHTVVDISEQGLVSPSQMDKSLSPTLIRPKAPLEQEQQQEQPSTQPQEQKEELLPVEPAADESKNTLIIKNLPFKFKQTDLDQLLEEHQAKPKNVRLLRDNAGRFTGIAFIRCPSKEEAVRLILSMNGLDIGGRSIQVEFKKRKSKKKQNLSASSQSLLSSSGDSEIGEEAVEPSRRLGFSDEIQPVLATSTSPESLEQQPIVSNQVPTAPMQKPNKLSVSAEHQIGNDKFVKRTQFNVQPQQQQQKQQSDSNPFAKYQRRKSMSAVEGRSSFGPNTARRSLEESGSGSANYPRSAVPRSLANSSDANNYKFAGIRPVRQPIGPDQSKGFSVEYRQSRKLVAQ